MMGWVWICAYCDCIMHKIAYSALFNDENFLCLMLAYWLCTINRTKIVLFCVTFTYILSSYTRVSYTLYFLCIFPMHYILPILRDKTPLYVFYSLKHEQRKKTFFPFYTTSSLSGWQTKSHVCDFSKPIFFTEL